MSDTLYSTLRDRRVSTQRRPPIHYATVHLSFTSCQGRARAAAAGHRAVSRAVDRAISRCSTRVVRVDRAAHGVTVVVSGDRGVATRGVQRLVDEVLADLRHEAPHVVVTRGTGTLVRDSGAIGRSCREAELTARIGALVHGPGSASSYRSLGAYPALYQAMHGAAGSAFSDLVDHYLGAALRYERASGLPILDTLAAYFAHHGNAAATARALRLNRQSLLYRLSRFESLTGVDLGSPTDRFALELAIGCLRVTQEA